MRVLFWSEQFWPSLGGAQIFGAKLIASLRYLGYEFLVVTSKYASDLPDEDQHSGVPIYRFAFREALGGAGMEWFSRVRSQVLKTKQEFNANLALINGISPSNLFYLMANRVQPTPVIVRINQEILCGEKQWDATITGKMLSVADWVACVSTPMLTQARELAPAISGRSSVIRNGLECPEVSPNPLPFETPVLLCLGRLVRQKGFDLALAAFATICDGFPKLRLVVAGDGPERASLQTQIAALGLANRVELCGWVAPEDIFNLINRATAVLMPSRLEGLPSVALQAGIMARPIVATHIGGLPEVVVDQESGLVVRSEDSAGLSKAIVYLLEHPEAAIRMGEAGRQRVKDLFSWDSCVIEYDRLFQQLAAQKLTGCVAFRYTNYTGKNDASFK